MTCKDCLHYERCLTLCELWKLSNDSSECVDFKDSSLSLGLPCRVGEKFWVVPNYGLETIEYECCGYTVIENTTCVIDQWDSVHNPNCYDTEFVYFNKQDADTKLR